MSFSLPGNDLYYLPRDDLPPEKYQDIIRPVFAWPKIDSNYVFDDRMHFGFQLINMRQRAFNGYTHQLPPHGPREREKLKNMIYRGEVVMLGGFSGTKGELFYIDEQGELICRDPRAFNFGGAQDVIREYKRSVARRDYSSRGGKPRPTVLPGRPSGVKQPAPQSTINSKAAGRLLAAGGIYNRNPEGFRQAAQQLGGDAPAGYDQMMSEQAKGLLIAGASVAAGLTMGRMKFPDLNELEAFGAKGTYTLRQFDPEKAGGPIEHLTTEGVTITHEGITIVEKHISRFDPDPGNEFMVTRLKKIADGEIPPEQVDLNFYTYECREFQRYCNLGWETGRPGDNIEAYELWNNTHTATLEDYRITGDKLYHPDAPLW
ncbi:hypothetical protein J2X14_003037 [Pantoea alhagi]|uniref:hypothetical protein n=1 Tax=Mixta sp. BE291 TaxID=3158787 RepID=UPI00285DD128|nr:hypothetical protein [Pantoea alhagi]